MIEARGLTKQYGDKTAVHDLSFQVRPGIVTGFLGPNGSGKSTTMRMILGLDAPTSGEVTVSGMPYRRLPNAPRHVGALLDAKAVHGGRSARQHLMCLAQLAGATFERAKLQRASLSAASLPAANLQQANLQGALLTGARLEMADLSGAALQGASLIGARLAGAVLRNADLEGAELPRARLYGADLRGAKLQAADLAGAIVWRTAPPAGDDSVAYCMQRYKSYDPASGTYLGYDGQRHPCPAQ